MTDFYSPDANAITSDAIQIVLDENQRLVDTHARFSKFYDGAVYLGVGSMGITSYMITKTSEAQSYADFTEKGLSYAMLFIGISSLVAGCVEVCEGVLLHTKSRKD